MTLCHRSSSTTCPPRMPAQKLLSAPRSAASNTITWRTMSMVGSLRRSGLRPALDLRLDGLVDRHVGLLDVLHRPQGAAAAAGAAGAAETPVGAGLSQLGAAAVRGPQQETALDRGDTEQLRRPGQFGVRLDGQYRHLERDRVP